MLFTAHQLGHKVSIQAAPSATPIYKSGYVNIIGVGCLLPIVLLILSVVLR